jgi:hypothetical protein
MHLVGLLLEGNESTFSYSKWVEGALLKGLVQPDLDEIPLEERFGRRIRLYRNIKRKLQSKMASPDDGRSLEWVNDQPPEFARDSPLGTPTIGSLNHIAKAQAVILRDCRE